VSKQPAVRRGATWLLGVVLLVVAAALLGPPLRPAPPTSGPRAESPRLVVLVAIDQFRYDYLTRFRDEYEAGLARLLRDGASFTNATLQHYPTVTAAGHATMLSGAPLSVSGIIGNDWFDRDSGKTVTSVSDETVTRLGGSGQGASPRRLLVSTLGDELKMSGKGDTRVIGISRKDRGAIFTAGHMADGAYWVDSQTGGFVSSTFYFKALPAWVEEFNRRRLPDTYAGKSWEPLRKSGSGAPLATMPAETGPKLYDALEPTPFGNEVLEAFAETAVDALKLGQRGATDLLTVSFSANDSVGHEHGPDSAQVHDMCLRTDVLLGRFLDFLDRRVGAGRFLVVLTADHGVAPRPEWLAERRMPGGRMETATLKDAIQHALAREFGDGQWILSTAGTSPYLNHALIREKRLDPAVVRRVAATAVGAVPHVARVFTREQLLGGDVPPDPVSQRVVRSYYPGRSGDLEILLEPYWIRGRDAATHGTPYLYDTHIPIVFMGPGVKRGLYDRATALNDVAPTLATMLEVEIPSGSSGRVLDEMLAGR
jgi:predicted AlkP superfamily pyrophosphatase or phosphodiesterase